MPLPIFTPLFKWDPATFIPLYPPLKYNASSMFANPWAHIPKHTLPDPIPNIYKNENIQRFCLFVLSQIHKSVYSNLMIRKMRENVSVEFENIPTIDYVFKHLFAFYLKGGNALPLLYLASGESAAMPYNFSGDFDCSVLINPDFDASLFKTIREIIIVEIVNVLKSVVIRPKIWASILHELYKYNLEFEPLTANTIQLHQEALTPDDMDLHQYVYSKDFESWRSFDGCPFQIEIHPNLPYKEQSQNISVFKLKLRTIPSIDLIDIAIPSYLNKYIKFEWDIHGGIPYMNNHHGIVFYFSNFINTYIDYRVSAFLDARKRTKRNERARRLRNDIINPMLKAGILKMHVISRLKEKKYNSDLGINMDEILRNISNL